MRKSFTLILCLLLSLNIFCQKKTASDSSRSFVADYQLSTQLRNKKGQIQKTFTRDIKILDVQVFDNRTKYHLFVLKFGFEDPKFQQFLKNIRILEVQSQRIFLMMVCAYQAAPIWQKMTESELQVFLIGFIRYNQF